MSTEGDLEPTVPSRQRTEPALPTALFSVVWSRGHCYVREGTLGRAHWVGVDDRGRPQALTDADLRRRGWSLRRA